MFHNIPWSVSSCIRERRHLHLYTFHSLCNFLVGRNCPSRSANW